MWGKLLCGHPADPGVNGITPMKTFFTDQVSREKNLIPVALENSSVACKKNGRGCPLINPDPYDLERINWPSVSWGHRLPKSGISRWQYRNPISWPYPQLEAYLHLIEMLYICNHPPAPAISIETTMVMTGNTSFQETHICISQLKSSMLNHCFPYNG